MESVTKKGVKKNKMENALGRPAQVFPLKARTCVHIYTHTHVWTSFLETWIMHGTNKWKQITTGRKYFIFILWQQKFQPG